jgi:hypothetical protein
MDNYELRLEVISLMLALSRHNYGDYGDEVVFFRPANVPYIDEVGHNNRFRSSSLTRKSRLNIEANCLQLGSSSIKIN